MDETALAEQMAQRAFVQVQAAREASGGTLLDFTLESLATLDALIARHMPRLRTDPQDVAEVVGAYLGEVLRRQLGCRWCWQDGKAVLQRPDGGGFLDPVERARLRLVHGRRYSLWRYAKLVQEGAEQPEAVATARWRLFQR